MASANTPGSPCGTYGEFAVTAETVTCTYTTLGADAFTVSKNDTVTSVHVVTIEGGGGGG